jgi:hypothetical protein
MRGRVASRLAGRGLKALLRSKEVRRGGLEYGKNHVARSARESSRNYAKMKQKMMERASRGKYQRMDGVVPSSGRSGYRQSSNPSGKKGLSRVKSMFNKNKDGTRYLEVPKNTNYTDDVSTAVNPRSTYYPPKGKNARPPPSSVKTTDAPVKPTVADDAATAPSGGSFFNRLKNASAEAADDVKPMNSGLKKAGTKADDAAKAGDEAAEKAVKDAAEDAKEAAGKDPWVQRELASAFMMNLVGMGIDGAISGAMGGGGGGGGLQQDYDDLQEDYDELYEMYEEVTDPAYGATAPYEDNLYYGTSAAAPIVNENITSTNVFIDGQGNITTNEEEEKEYYDEDVTDYVPEDDSHWYDL